MKVLVFSAKAYEKSYFTAANQEQHQLDFIEAQLDESTAALASGYDAVCVFVNDKLDKSTLNTLAANHIKLIALRCAGFNNLDQAHAKKLGIAVVYVPKYSPYAVAEHALCLILALNRKIHRAYNRVREYDFSLHGLMGFDLNGKTVGVVGTGAIGSIFASNMIGLNCRVLASDPYQNKALIEKGVTYVSLDELLQQSDIISLHCPLTSDSKHLINDTSLAKMKKGVMLINTSRGGLLDTKAAINALKTLHLGALGLDVYEEEASLFFSDKSDQIVTDDLIARLLTFPNVVLTGHQAYFTQEAMQNIAETTIQNITTIEQGFQSVNLIPSD
jgi:D-lactate dehydrogenase